jgi:cob(I)alamin adenosyltransferase
MNEEEKQALHQETQLGFQMFLKDIQSNAFDLVVADELLGCIQNGLINETELLNGLKNKNHHVEVIISGRYLSPFLQELADLVTKFNGEKHYFNNQVSARKGIEF